MAITRFSCRGKVEVCVDYRQSAIPVFCSDSISVYSQFGCPTVDPMIARPYAVARVPNATNMTRSKLKVFNLTVMPNILRLHLPLEMETDAAVELVNILTFGYHIGSLTTPHHQGHHIQ